jgi:feruloyl esterase
MHAVVIGAAAVAVAAATGLPLASGSASRAAQCEGLSALHLPNTTLTEATVVAGGSFTPPGANQAISGLPGFCRVTGVIKPTSTSEIVFETWLPLEKWNKKFAAVGNGGWSGIVSYGALADQIRRGYASASTNTGHVAAPGMDMAKFAFDYPVRLIDFASRSEHETTVVAKALVESFYGQAPERSYWIGCSTGGKQGLTEAQRYPADYDGIVAGAPANNWTRLMLGTLDMILAAAKDSATFLPPPVLRSLNRAALAACDGIDGVIDGVIDDPRKCRFDPASIECKGGEAPPSCLTHAQVEAARRVYRGPTDPRSAASLYPGLEPGSEQAWVAPLNPAQPFAIPLSYYRWLVFRDSTWNWKTFDLAHPSDARVVDESEATLRPILSAINPDIDAFRARGGKLIQYHGWADMLIAPRNSIDYYESVVQRLTDGRSQKDALAEVDRSYRLFMVPGMAHCAGGPGPNQFDAEAALERWVENGVAPDKIIATHANAGVTDRSRPLCPYPKVAVYSGSGDTNDAANFVCRER